MIQFSEELLGIIDSTDFSDGGIEIIAVEPLGAVLNINIELWDDFDAFPRQQWKLECSGIKDYKLQESYCGGLKVITEHPLLYPYNTIQSELFFNGTTDKLKELLADIMISHNKVVGYWFSLKDFIHQIPCIANSHHIKDTDFKFGLFAKGSDIVMKEYLKVLEMYNIQANIINHRESGFYDGATYVTSANDNVVLFIGKNYLITNSIKATKLSG